MKNLTLAILLGGLGASCGGDFDKGLAAYRSGDYATALSEIRPLAEQGDARGQALMGVMYDRGRGVLQDKKTAVKWFTLAAEQGDAAAQYNLGVMYADGRGVPEDYVYAHMWSNIAASQGYQAAADHRERAARKMTSAEISAAQKLFYECVDKEYKGC